MQYVQHENPDMHIVDIHPGQVRETDMAAKAPGERHEGVSYIDDDKF
tara:strand:+ start:701 stop:841 length:141 start_codon:yes stop_codon:yes gene_type:complete